jgi:hypothetical protein
VSSFGAFGGFPFTLGGDDEAEEVAYHALLSRLEPAYDSQDAFIQGEVAAHAAVVRIAWDVSARLRNQVVPERMMEALPDWEQALYLRPTPEQTDYERRAAVAAKLRGVPNNALADIEEAMVKLLGNTFVALKVVAPADEIVFWPGVNPGPPGFEWSSNRRIVAVQLTKAGTPDDALFARKMAAAKALLGSMLPADMLGVTQVGLGAIYDIAIYDEDFYGP